VRRACAFRLGDKELDRTLVVVESQELLRGQKRGIAVALRKAKENSASWSGVRRVDASSARHWRTGCRRALRREHLSEFVIATVKRGRGKVSLHWHVDAARRRLLERTRLGRRVLCTDHHAWTTGRIVLRFPGPVECGGTVPTSQERRRRILGAISPVGRTVPCDCILRGR